MSRRSLVSGLLLFLAGLTGFAVGRGQEKPTEPPAPQPKLTSLEDQASYAIGLKIGRDFAADKSVKPDLVAKGFLDGLKKAKPLLTEDEIKSAITAYTKKIQEKAAAELKPLAEKNLKDGKAFLAANKNKPGVTVSPSGLQYEVLKSGTGESPKKTDKVSVHVVGKLLDGKVFDNTIERKEPAKFPIAEAFPAWSEALTKMKVGDKWKLFAPADLTFGDKPGPGGPNAVLIYEMELLEIVK